MTIFRPVYRCELTCERLPAMLVYRCCLLTLWIMDAVVFLRFDKNDKWIFQMAWIAVMRFGIFIVSASTLLWRRWIFIFLAEIPDKAFLDGGATPRFSIIPRCLYKIGGWNIHCGLKYYLIIRGGLAESIVWIYSSLGMISFEWILGSTFLKGIRWLLFEW